MEGDALLPALLLSIAPIGVIAGLVWAWRQGTVSTAALTGCGAAGGFVGGMVANMLSAVLPGDWRGFGLLGVHVLGAILGGAIGLLVSGIRAVLRLVRERTDSRGPG